MKPILARVARPLLPMAMCFCSSVASAALDGRLLAAARAAEPAVIESLKGMVSIESSMTDLPALTRMTDCAERRLKALGSDRA